MFGFWSITSLSLADDAPEYSVCPHAEPVRVACFGDSLTAGDNTYNNNKLGVISTLPAAARGLNAECKLGSHATSCRGSFPRVLQALLGPRFDVQAFGEGGLALTDLLPRACRVESNESTRVEVVPLTAGPNASSTEVAAVARCRNSFSEPSTLEPTVQHRRPVHKWRGAGRHPLVQGVVDFKPSIVVLLMGTNDAGEAKLARFGEAGALTTMAHLVAALLRSAEPAPLVYVLDPPRTMGEPPSQARGGGLCVRQHICRWHPKLPCWVVAECVTCAAGDRVSQGGGWVRDSQRNVLVEKPWQPAEQSCVRADALRSLRTRVAGAAVEGAARRARTRSPTERTTAKACQSRGVMAAKPSLAHHIRPDWQNYAGPVHLNTIGSASIACLVHQGLFHRCAPHCEGNLSAQMAERHELFCGRFDQLRREDPLPRKELDGLEQRLHTSNSDASAV